MFSLEFIQGKRAGQYENCRYPNLLEIHPYFPTSYYANVTDELMLAVFRGEEELTDGELQRIAHYNRIPLSVLICPKMITLSRERWRHRQMMNHLETKLYEIWELQKRGSREAENYMVRYPAWGRTDYVNMELAFRNGYAVTYGHYLGVKHRMEDTISFAEGECREKPRSISA